jgi:septum site-determining protein MinC
MVADLSATVVNRAVVNNEVPMVGQGNDADLLSELGAPIGEPIPGAVNIRGRAGGVLIEIGKGSWAEIIVVLTDRLARAASFFRNGKVALELGPRVLNEQELRQLYHLLAQHHLTLGLIRTAAPDTFQLALALGLAAHLENPESRLVTTAQAALGNVVEEQHFVYSGHLRAGQVLRRQEHILVIGDVNPGATVISDGDILVWGRLRGVAHAGAGGDERAVIVALDLAPVQLRIDETLAIAPEAQPNKSWGPWRRPTMKQPEIAYLTGNEIVVEAWDATKFGGIATLRR